MTYMPLALGFAVALLLGMMLFLEIGHRLGDHVERLDPEGAHSGTGPVDGAVFALLGLLVAFTFSGAASRFDARRQLIIEEANDIGTAYLRLALLPADAQPALRDLFKRYVDVRLAAYRQRSMVAARDQLKQMSTLQGEIWSRATTGCAAAGAQPCAVLLMPALNAMFDVTTTRTSAVQMHPPIVVFSMLCALAFACALLAGYSMASGERRKWAHSIVFAAVTALTVYVILDLEYPRLGFIRVDEFDRVIMDVRASMDGQP